MIKFLICLFFGHNYELLEKTSTSNCSKVNRVKGIGGEDLERLERLCFGITTVLLKCRRCSKLKKEEMLGL